MSLARVACVVPAKDEAETIAATVTAAAALPGVQIVLVCDDGSSDRTEQLAAAAGAIVVTHKRTRGKAAAIESAVNALGVLEQRDNRPDCGVILLVDGDVGEAAARLGPLLRPVQDGEVDLAIAVPEDPPDGIVAATARRGVAELTGWTPTSPLSGQRCLTRRAFEMASPLAPGWGAEVGMTVDVLRAGLRVREYRLGVQGPERSGELTGPLHQAAQLRHVTRALASRGLVEAGLREFKDAGGVQGLLNRFKR